MPFLKDFLFCATGILLGRKVCDAFGAPFVPNQRSPFNARLLVLNHPSGLCRAWGQPDAFLKARRAVAEFAPEISPLLGSLETSS